MPSHYSIVQYVPDPITDERINVGVIVTGDGGGVRVRFLSHWQRARQFGLSDVSFIQEFARAIEMRQGELDLSQTQWSEPVLRRLSSEWVRSIQFTEPRASLKDVDSLFEDRRPISARRRPSRPLLPPAPGRASVDGAHCEGCAASQVRLRRRVARQDGLRPARRLERGASF